jgi:hypothetical protein
MCVVALFPSKISSNSERGRKVKGSEISDIELLEKQQAKLQIKILSTLGH